MEKPEDRAEPTSSKDLPRLLIEMKVISPAQAQLAIADQEVSGMTFEEVLIARHWVDEATLEKIAPWLKATSRNEPPPLAMNVSDDYEENLRHYRQIVERILGESWD